MFETGSIGPVTRRYVRAPKADNEQRAPKTGSNSIPVQFGGGRHMEMRRRALRRSRWSRP